MARTLDDLLAERPGNPKAQEAHMVRMQSEVRAYRLRELREQFALTQTDLAEVLKVSQKRVSELESGEVARTKVDTLQRYANALGGTLRIDVLIGDQAYQIA